MNGENRWQRMLSDVLLLYVLPLLVGLLPWRAGFALLKRVARRPSILRPIVQAAWQHAGHRLPALDEATFCHRYRLLLLVDRCDTMLCLLRSARWWRSQVDVQGDAFEQLPPGLLLNSHWGSGNWIWRLLMTRGLPAQFVARRAQATDVGRSWLGSGYLAWRSWAMHRSGCRGLIYTGGSSARVLEVLRQGQSIVGMLDLPARPDQSGADVSLLGRNLRFPVGLAALAEQAGASISIISCGLDMDSGRRRLHLEFLPPGLGADEILRRYAAHLERRIETEPAQWQAWPQASEYFA